MSQHQTLPRTGLVRLSQILAPRGPIPVGRSTWWAGINAGRYPRPLKLGPRITAWRAEEIWALVESGTIKQRNDATAGPTRSQDKVA